MRFIPFLLLAITTTVFAQRTQTINADCLRMGLDGICIDKAEFETLSGATANIQYQIDQIGEELDLKADSSGLTNVDNTSDLNKPISTATQSALDLKANDSDVVHKTGDESISGTKTFTGKLVASSTTNGSNPCPVMTEAQRDLIASPVNGECVFNSTSSALNIYITATTSWEAVGTGSGAISVISKNTTYTAASGDDLILSDATSAAFTITLPSASGLSGTQIRIKKIDSSTNVVTIEGDGTETIDGALNKNLASKDEFIHITSDGTNWVVNERFVPSVFANYTTTVSGLGAGSHSTTARIKRVGDSAIIAIAFQKDATPGSGASQVTFSLPTGLSADTAKLPVIATSFFSTTKSAYAVVNAGTPTVIGLGENGTTTNLTGADIVASRIIRFTIIVPISGWE
jgi:hypothetical protein